MSVQQIQPQDRRPKKAAERASTRKQKAMDSTAVGVTIDGRDYVISPSDLTGRVEFEIRKECGMGVAEIVDAMNRTMGIDYLGMYMWAVRRAHGETVDLMDVLDEVSADADVEVMTPKQVSEALEAGPKASGNAS